jgi:hypothetical protein
VAFELRVGEFRVLYNVEADKVVSVLVERSRSGERLPFPSEPGA